MPAGVDNAVDNALVAGWREEQLLALGLDGDDAQWVSYTDIDWHDLAALVARGCDPQVALKILA